MISLLKALASPDIAPVTENLHHTLMATQQAQDDFEIENGQIVNILTNDNI